MVSDENSGFEFLSPAVHILMRSLDVRPSCPCSVLSLAVFEKSLHLNILGRTVRKLIFGDVFKNGKLLDTISDAKEDDYEVVVYWEKCGNAHRTKTGVYVTCSAAHTKWGVNEIMEHVLVNSHDVIDFCKSNHLIPSHSTTGDNLNLAVIKASGFIEEKLKSNDGQKSKKDNWEMTFGNSKLVDTPDLIDPRKQAKEAKIESPGIELAGFDNIPELARNDDIKCENGQSVTVPDMVVVKAEVTEDDPSDVVQIETVEYQDSSMDSSMDQKTFIDRGLDSISRANMGYSGNEVLPKKRNFVDDVKSKIDAMKMTCKVCGDVASGLHYGVESCEGCKVCKNADHSRPSC